MEELISPKQYVEAIIMRCPTLYGGTGDFDVSRVCVLDQLLNVNGNGIRDDRELIGELLGVYKTMTPLDDRHVNENIWYGYTKVKTIGTFMMPDGDCGRSIDCVESDKGNYPDVKLWIQATGRDDLGLNEERPAFNPYPNFSKNYSTIWSCPIYLSLGNAWLNEAIWFYEQCKEYFLDDEKCQYSYSAYPNGDRGKSDKQLKDMTDIFERVIEREGLAYVQSQYGGTVEYKGDGDIHGYLSECWVTSRREYLEFCDETIDLLKGHLK